MPHAVELLGFDCPFVERARMVLELKGVHYHYTSLTDFTQAPAWFKELNPFGRVPVLVHEGRAIYESAVINEYVDEVFGGPCALPRDAYLRAMARVLVGHCDKAFIGGLFALLMNRDASKHAPRWTAVVEAWRFLDAFLRQHNPDGELALGEELGIADITYAPFFARTAAIRHYRHFALPEDGSCDRAQHWADACLRHPIVKRVTLPREHIIKLYYSHARGYGAGVRPPVEEYNSADPAWAYEDRPMPRVPREDYWDEPPDRGQQPPDMAPLPDAE